MTGLSLFLHNALALFAALTERPELLPEDALFCAILLGLGVLLCLFGCRAYRGFFAVLSYIAVAVLWCVTQKGQLAWGTIVAGFSVTGCVLAFLAFRRKMLGAVLLSALLSGVVAYVFYPDLRVALGVGAVVLLLAYGLPVYSICITTAGFGALLLWEAAGFLWFGDTIPIYAAVLAALVGAALQLLICSRRSPDIAVYHGWAQKMREAAENKAEGAKNGTNS